MVKALICLFFCISSMAYGEAPKPIPPVSGKTEASNKKDNPATPKQEITVTVPSSPNVNLGGKLDVKSEPVEKRTNEEPSKWLDPVTWFTLVLAVATVLLWLRTADLASSTKKLADESKSTAEKQLRAYVGLENIFIIPFDEQSSRVYAVQNRACQYFLTRLNNFGQTPAKNLSIRVTVTTAPKQGDISFPVEYGKPIVEGQLLHSGQSYSVSKMIDREGFTAFFREATKAEPQINLFFVGVVEYDDINSDRWRTRFCHRWEPSREYPHSLNAYKEHNNEEYVGKVNG